MIANKIKPKVKKVIDKFPTYVDFYRDVKNEFGEPGGKDLVCSVKGFYHEGNTQISAITTDKGQVKRSKQMFLMVIYDEDTVTDQPLRQIVAELIREKALHALNEEIPHGIAVVIDTFKDRKSPKGKITERDSHKGIIIGKGGEMLKKIGTNARYEIEKQLGNKVNLKLWVKVKKEWRDSDILIKNFGYDKKDNKTQN